MTHTILFYLLGVPQQGWGLECPPPPPKSGYRSGSPPMQEWVQVGFLSAVVGAGVGAAVVVLQTLVGTHVQE